MRPYNLSRVTCHEKIRHLAVFYGERASKRHAISLFFVANSAEVWYILYQNHKKEQEMSEIQNIENEILKQINKLPGIDGKYTFTSIDNVFVSLGTYFSSPILGIVLGNVSLPVAVLERHIRTILELKKSLNHQLYLNEEFLEKYILPNDPFAIQHFKHLKFSDDFIKAHEGTFPWISYYLDNPLSADNDPKLFENLLTACGTEVPDRIKNSWRQKHEELVGDMQLLQDAREKQKKIDHINSLFSAKLVQEHITEPPKTENLGENNLKTKFNAGATVVTRDCEPNQKVEIINQIRGKLNIINFENMNKDQLMQFNIMLNNYTFSMVDKSLQNC